MLRFKTEKGTSRPRPSPRPSGVWAGSGSRGEASGGYLTVDVDELRGEEVLHHPVVSRLGRQVETREAFHVLEKPRGVSDELNDIRNAHALTL